MCDKDTCNDASCCGECEPWNCVEQQINDALATKEDQLQGYVSEAKDAAAESKASAEASAQSAAESKEFRDEAETAASTAVAAEGVVLGVANTLQDTADKLEQIADELGIAIAGIAVSSWFYTTVSENQTVIPVPADKNAVDVQSIYIEGARQSPFRGFEFDKTAMIITLAEPLPLGLEIEIILGTYNSDNPNDFAHTLASNNGASLVGTSSGKTVETSLNDLDQQIIDADAKLRADLAEESGSNLIGFKYSNNAIRRLVADKLRDFVSIDDFGGKGNGTDVDDNAFQVACTFAKKISLTPGKEYVLKNGFGINASNIVISGYGAKIKYIKPDANYYHAIRVGTSGQAVVGNIVLEGFSIYCADATFVRGDTGFAISVANAFEVDIHDITISSIASAGIWCGTTDVINIHNVTVLNNLADGIHITDGATNFRITNCFVRGCNDDAIAVVSDTPSDGILPIGGVVANNIVSDNLDGHAFIAIGCASVLWEGNLAKGCKGPGFGSYFWQTTGTPADEDWVRNCTFRNNVVTSCGLGPVNAVNATSFFVGALKDCVIENNRISGAPAFTSAGTEANCLLIANALNVIIQENTFHNSDRYGVYTRDGNTSAVASFSDIHILRNTFDLIAQDAIHIFPTADIGAVSVVDNTLISTPFNTALGRSMIVGKTRANKLTIAGNKNLYNNLPFSFDALTAQNVVAYSNMPALELQWSPTVSGVEGVPTASAQGFYTREGDTINFTINLDITALNGATAPVLTLPTEARDMNRIWAVGRENSRSGAAVLAIPINVSTFFLLKYDSTSFMTGAIVPINVTLHGSYLTK